jgi:hypothetical protein
MEPVVLQQSANQAIVPAPTLSQRHPPLVSVGGFMARRTQPRTHCRGFFFTGMPVWCRSVAGSQPRTGVGCCAPLLTRLPSLCIHSVSLGQSGFLAPARHPGRGCFFGSDAVATAGGQPERVSKRADHVPRRQALPGTRCAVSDLDLRLPSRDKARRHQRLADRHPHRDNASEAEGNE